MWQLLAKTFGTGHFNLAQGVGGTATGLGAALSTLLGGYLIPDAKLERRRGSMNSRYLDFEKFPARVLTPMPASRHGEDQGERP